MTIARSINVKIGFGEAYDKLSILAIKLKKITDPVKLANVEREYGDLAAALGGGFGYELPFGLYHALLNVNEQLWDVEDSIRQHHASGDFGKEFVELAISVYTLNDLRASIKKRINENCNSEYIEEKQYVQY